jgi:hypothetical protein
VPHGQLQEVQHLRWLPGMVSACWWRRVRQPLPVTVCLFARAVLLHRHVFIHLLLKALKQIADSNLYSQYSNLATHSLTLTASPPRSCLQSRGRIEV